MAPPLYKGGWGVKDDIEKANWSYSCLRDRRASSTLASLLSNFPLLEAELRHYQSLRVTPLLSLLTQPEYIHLQVVHLPSPKATGTWLENLRV